MQRCDNNSTGLSLALSFDDTDPPCVDLYTQDEMHLGGGDRLFFPSAFGHAVLNASHKPDGFLDVRMAVSRDNGKTMSYPPARDARRPYVGLGINECGQTTTGLEPGMDPPGLAWCQSGDPPAIVSAFDTSMLTVVTGAAESSDGNHLYQYYNGARRTHGDTTTAAGEGMAIGALRMRLDGFVSAEAPYIFNIPTSELPQFTTVPVRVPSCRGSEQPALALNFESSVAGFVLVGLRTPSGAAIPGHSVDEADQSKGNFISKLATWHSGRWALTGLEQTTVAIHVVASDASIFSLELSCRNQTGTPPRASGGL